MDQIPWLPVLMIGFTSLVVSIYLGWRNWKAPTLTAGLMVGTYLLIGIVLTVLSVNAYAVQNPYSQFVYFWSYNLHQFNWAGLPLFLLVLSIGVGGAYYMGSHTNWKKENFDHCLLTAVLMVVSVLAGVFIGMPFLN